MTTHIEPHTPTHRPCLSTVTPDYDAKRVKAFTFCVVGYGDLAGPPPGRRLLHEEEEEETSVAQPRELAPVEYVKTVSLRILDCQVGIGRKEGVD